MAVAFTTSVLAVGAAVGVGIQAKGRMWLALGINLTWGVITLTVVWLTAHRAGALSVAYGTAIGYLLTTIGAFLYLRKELPKGMLQRMFEAIVVSVVTLLVCSALSPPARIILAVPAVVLVSCITLMRLSSRGLRQAIWPRITAALAIK